MVSGKLNHISSEVLITRCIWYRLESLQRYSFLWTGTHLTTMTFLMRWFLITNPLQKSLLKNF